MDSFQKSVMIGLSRWFLDNWIMFDVKQTLLNDEVHKYLIVRNKQPISYIEAVTLWQEEKAFRESFSSVLRDSPFDAYRWETPPLTKDGQGDFEFVLLDSPSLARPPNTKSFESYFPLDQAGTGVVAFENLSKSSLLVVPCPQNPQLDYTHLAVFTRNAPETQQHAFWQRVGQTVEQSLSNRALWVSTAGGGVAWLHVRLDQRPKYYRHQPYRSAS